MRGKLVWLLVISLATAVVSADAASAKKSRSKSSATSSRVKKETKQGRGSRKVSSSDKRAGKRGAREEQAGRRSRGKRGRYASRSKRNRRQSYEPRVASDTTPSRPTSSGIPPERVTEIQNALIKVGYLDGPATGQYDDNTIEAMKQYQSANRLPQTGLPSAPVLKKLGVSKRSNDGYAVPVNRVSETEKSRPPE